MADLSPAEIMLDNAPKIQSLIKCLQAVLAAPVSYPSIDLSRQTKAHIAAFQADLQSRIDELSAQRGKAVELVKRIPDQTTQEVLSMRYGLTGSGREMTWVQIEMRVPYSPQSLFRYHKKGIAQLNEILKNGG